MFSSWCTNFWKCGHKLTKRQVQLETETGELKDINECLNETICTDLWSTCVNNMGSYLCVSVTIRFRSFFKAEGGMSCEQKNGGCSQICTEVSGGYECSCRDGFELDDGGHTCVDINECLNWPCQQTCTNTEGGYNCDCDNGFQLGEDGQTCNVRNSCSDGSNGGCDHICHQLYGARLCDCRQGYKLGLDGFTCEDIDECQIYGPCSQKCNNTVGAYECSCFAGYMLNNTNICIDINECDDPDVCDGFVSACLNSHGSFSCISLDALSMADDAFADAGTDKGDQTLSSSTPPTGPESEALSSSTQLIIVVCVMGGVVLLLIIAAAAGFMVLFKRMDGGKNIGDAGSQLHRPRAGDVESLPRGGSCVGEQRSYTFNP